MNHDNRTPDPVNPDPDEPGRDAELDPGEAPVEPTPVGPDVPDPSIENQASDPEPTGDRLDEAGAASDQMPPADADPVHPSGPDPSSEEADPDVDMVAVSAATWVPDDPEPSVGDRIEALQQRIAVLESRPVRPGFAALVVAVVITLLGAFTIGRITASDDADEAAANPTALPAATTTRAPATTLAQAPTTAVPAPSTTETPSTTGVPPVVLPNGSTVADIAALVGPGVVQIETGSSLGSGVIYDAAGYILTAAHVVNTTDDFVTVRLADGRAFDGEIVGTHTPTDVAVIKIEPVEGLKVIELAPADSLEIGELAIALGSPFGLEQTVTAGIVSAVDRIVDGVIMVQTDAAINPGNSGGPLVDELGRVIGINDQIFTLSGGNQGVGFAISIELAILIAEQIVAGDDVQLAVLGVTVSPADGDPPGALVLSVVEGSAAEAAGIEEGDLITEADGRLIINSDALRARVIKKRPGDALELKILRDGEELVLNAVLGSTEA